MPRPYSARPPAVGAGHARPAAGTLPLKDMRPYHGCMSRVEEIERAIRDLSPDEFAQVAQHVRALERERWDAQMDRDAVNGRFDFLIAEALESRKGAAIHPVQARSIENHLNGERTTTARILAFADQFAAGMAREHESPDHASLLYGDDGLPR